MNISSAHRLPEVGLEHIAQRGQRMAKPLDYSNAAVLPVLVVDVDQDCNSVRSKSGAEADMISWPPDKDNVMTVAGFEDALAAAVRVQIQT